VIGTVCINLVMLNGFVDDVKFLYNGPRAYGASHILLSGDAKRHRTTASISTKFFVNDKDCQIQIVRCTMGVKCAIYDFICFICACRACIHNESGKARGFIAGNYGDRVWEGAPKPSPV